jgi:flagellar M-ring protein FliF
MADLAPSSPLAPATRPVERLRGLTEQPAVRRALPWVAGLAGLGALALTWSLIATAPQRVLYSDLGDAEKAGVAAALDKAGIGYAIDSGTGAVTVNADELYKARMLVASDGALAAPDSGNDMLAQLPLGASRAIEGDRLRAAREHELMLTIMEIDGVEAARVHLAEPKQSVFVRDDVPPSASVMVRLAKGRQLSDSQVSAVLNLVAASVPGLSIDAVRIVDQNGRLLSERKGEDADRFELQARMEEKLRGQLDQLLAPMLGAGNFSSEIQVELDMEEITKARESYDKEGVIRSETQSASQSGGAGQAGGIPGVLANTPPPATQASPGPPEGGAAAADSGQTGGESSSQKTYELGREVSVANSGPGAVKRISVAVALSQEALKGGKPADTEAIKQLVSAAVGANAERGDQVAVMVRPFQKVEEEVPPFYEAPWFAMVVRSLLALIGVVLVLLLAVKPLLKLLKREPRAADGDQTVDGGELAPHPVAPHDPEALVRQIGLAKQMVDEAPQSAAQALRLMLVEQKKEDAA